MKRRRRVLLILGVALVVAAATGLTVGRWLRSGAVAAPDTCVITALGRSVGLEPQQVTNAATIAAVGGRRGLPAHAVTVALAAALQESKLRNLPYGDRDSVGLFQQRPSQGWGTPAQIIDPRYAAGRFYARLALVSGWQELPVAEAAQRVQRSADGSAYAVWESPARAMAEGLTGHAGAAVACKIRRVGGDPAGLPAAALTDFGAHALDRPVVDPVRGWSVAGWLVAHARTYRLVGVSYLGRTWSPSTGAWKGGGSADQRVRYVIGPAPKKS